jgi:hypothetical protein
MNQLLKNLSLSTLLLELLPSFGLSLMVARSSITSSAVSAWNASLFWLPGSSQDLPLANFGSG